MLVRETIRSAWRSLLSNRLRTALTALGMVIGVMAVIAVLAIGAGAQANVESRIRALGSNLLMIRPGWSSVGGVRGTTVQTLTRKDAEALAALPGVTAVSPEISGSAQIRYRELNQGATVMGVTADYLQVRAFELAHGLPFSSLDEQQRRRVAIIGAGVARDLFDVVTPIGKRLQLNGVAFIVIGVLEEKGGTYGSPDDNVMVPLSTHQGVLFGNTALSSINVAVASEGQMPTVQARVEELLRLRHRLRPDQASDFQIRSQTEMLQTMGAVTQTFTMLLGSVAAVSLLVGGIGIMNIMLVAVSERTHEIGVRMAVGARRRDILLQFLVEAVVVSTAGGFLGIALGYLGAYLIARFAEWDTIVPIYGVVLAVSVSLGVGVIFGVGPARRAAALDPVDALRHD
jgi:putative ABC transport system permease protein